MEARISLGGNDSETSRRRMSRVLVATVALALVTLVLWSTQTYLVGSTVASIDARTGWTAAQETTAADDELRYHGIVIDCGSSGSRIYIYDWPEHTGEHSRLLDISEHIQGTGGPAVLKVEPGVSSYATDPAGAYNSLRPLLNFALENVPQDQIKLTQLYIFATAGLRMVTDAQQTAILHAIRAGVKEEYSFGFTDEHVDVITGRVEGIYGWIAVNYALGRLNPVKPLVYGASTSPLTVGVLDMGGGSQQITYEVSPSEQTHIIPEHLIHINLGCEDNDPSHSYDLYTATHLSYGANAARDRYIAALVKNHAATSKTIVDPCLLHGLDESLPSSSVNLQGGGDFDACERNVRAWLMPSDGSVCSEPPCSFDGVHMAAVDAVEEFYGLSEYWYTTRDIYGIDGSFDWELFEERTHEYCSRNWTSVDTLALAGGLPNANPRRLRLQCFKAAWLRVTLRDAYRLAHAQADTLPADDDDAATAKRNKKLTTAERIDGKLINWTLGAIVFLTRFFPLRAVQQRDRSLHEHLNLSSHLPSAIGTPVLMLSSAVVIGLILTFWIALVGRRRQRVFNFRARLP